MYLFKKTDGAYKYFSMLGEKDDHYEVYELKGTTFPYRYGDMFQSVSKEDVSVYDHYDLFGPSKIHEMLFNDVEYLDTLKDLY